MPVNPIPERYHTVTPYLIASDAKKLIEFLKSTFAAAEVEMIIGPNGAIAHAEMLVGNSMIMLSQSNDMYPAMPTMLYVYVKDCDAVFKKAIAAGAISLKEPADQFYGDRNGTVKDHSGNHWCIGTHIEDVSPEVLKQRMQKMAEPS